MEQKRSKPEQLVFSRFVFGGQDSCTNDMKKASMRYTRHLTEDELEMSDNLLKKKLELNFSYPSELVRKKSFIFSNLPCTTHKEAEIGSLK